MSLKDFFQVVKGGAGSGNFGHSGVPGKHGGSAPKGGGGGVPTWLSDIPESNPELPGAKKVVLDDATKGSLRNTRDPKALRAAIKKLSSKGDAGESIGGVLEGAGWRYENGGNTVNGRFDLYIKGDRYMVEVFVDYNKNTTKSKLIDTYTQTY